MQWIPSHSDIPGNNKVDGLAKRVSKRSQPASYKSPDAKQFFKKKKKKAKLRYLIKHVGDWRYQEIKLQKLQHQASHKVQSSDWVHNPYHLMHT